MSRTTREINRITTTIISMSVRLLFYALVFFLLYEGITRGYGLGHEIFAHTAVAEAPGTDKEFTINKGESLSEVAGELEKSGLIKNKLICIIQAKLYDYEVYPGTYTLNTSMTSRDMMKSIDESGIEKKKAAESSAAASAAGSAEASAPAAGDAASADADADAGGDTGSGTETGGSGSDTGEDAGAQDNGAADEDGAYVS